MAILYLVRHCAQDNPLHILPGRLPTELSREGKQQAERLQQYFSNKNITTIYSSAVMRCKQTAEMISDGKIPIQYDRRLLETFSSYQGYWIEDWKHFFNHIGELGGESNQDIQERIVDFSLYQYFAYQPLLSQGTLDAPEDEYQPTGSVMIVRIDGNKATIEPFLTQKMLLDG